MYSPKSKYLGEHFPHVLNKLQELSGNESFYEYVDTLLLVEDSRESRKGFPFEAIQEINRIVEQHETVFYLIKHKPIDIWSPHCEYQS